MQYYYTYSTQNGIAMQKFFQDAKRLYFTATFSH